MLKQLSIAMDALRVTCLTHCESWFEQRRIAKMRLSNLGFDLNLRFRFSCRRH